MKNGKDKRLCRSSGGGNSAEYAQAVVQPEAEGALEEFYGSLEMNCLYVDIHRDTSRPGDVIPLHRHDFLELLLCSSGETAFLLNGQRLTLHRGDILAIPPGVRHGPLLEGAKEPYCRDVLWVSREYLAILAGLWPELMPMQAQVVHTGGTEQQELCRIFHGNIRQAERGQPGWEIMVLAGTAQLLVGIKRAAQSQAIAASRTNHTELPERCTALVRDNLARKISLADMAKRLYVSESTICHVFRERTGESFYGYVTRQRLEAAREQILRGVPMEQASREAGFANYSGFYRAFRREYGVSPSGYLRLTREADGDWESRE